MKGTLQQWLQNKGTIKFIYRTFTHFLKDHAEEKIHEMCQANEQSLQIVYNDLSNKLPTLAIWLAEEPALVLPILNQTTMDVLLELYPDYESVHNSVFVRIRDLPVEDKLRDLR